MNSIRARLTLSYAVIVAIVLVLVAALATRLLFEVLARPTYDALSASDVRARAFAAAHASLPPERLVPLVRLAAAGSGVVVFGGRFPGFGATGQGGPEEGPGGAPEATGGPGDSAGDGVPSGPRNGGRDGPGAPGPDLPPPFAGRGPLMGLLHADGLAWALGLAPRRIEVAGASVIVAPDLRSVEAALNESALALFLASLLAVVLSWLCARWLAAHALAPMIAVTEQLERFSSGDFKTRPIETNERAELGRLIGAYNGAVAQVDRALGERVETEQRLRRFLADAGHELRTPITVIGGYVEILRKGGFDDAVIRETALATLTGEVRRSRELVERLMRLVTLERPELSATTAVDVETLAREAIANVTRARGGDVTLACAAPAAVTADPAELQEAIGNLVDNALKYGGGTPVAVTVEPQGSDVFVRVRDGGPGIAPADRERIFERFFRAAEVRDVEGSGLGLAICERAVARCGGTVLLEDPAPGSTTFRLTLPAARMQRDGNAPIRF